jgi:spermidine synthase
MIPTGATTRGVLYALFTLSGFAGLVYESIWTHYLKLFLGHAAYAQTLVLAIFMGGLALGAWGVSAAAPRLARPLVAYAAVEAALGLLALGFDPLFRGMQQWAYDSAIPALGAPAAVVALKWTLAGIIILPQSVLLGMTFPLMSAGVVRLFPDIPGRVLAWLYFTNSAGAAAGVLVSGFALIAAVGLPGTVMTAGLINIAVVLAIWPIARRAGAPPAPAAVAAGPHPSRLLLAAAFLTGAASFFYEIGWIRMLSLVLSSATHSFELMLAAFIFGLALGSYWIRGHLDGLRDPLRTLAWIQALMATLALASLPLYAVTFDAMAWALGALARNEGGYVLFSLFSQALCLFLMLPVTVCAGMTLPLLTCVLLRGPAGESAIGRIYAANTVGAIAGVMAAVHVVMPLLGLRQVIVVGALVDLGLGLWLFAAAPRAPSPRRWLAPAALAGVALALAAFARLEPARLASGVFRTGKAYVDGEILMHRDGKTATVDVWRSHDGKLTIATNGKPDASLSPSAASTDDATQVLVGALPLLLHAMPADVAVVGMGSGRTTHVLLADPRVAAVDTIEIEPAMLEGAALFGDLVDRAFTDPRSRLHVEDAKTFFASRQRRFDVIISEPSNPWVSGVASLFSAEFYRHVRRYLKPGGHFVQWLQLYEIDLPLVATVFNALAREFVDYQIYAADDYNLVIVASAEAPVGVPDARALERLAPALRELLRFVGVEHAADLALRHLGGRATLAPLFASTGMPANSDYFPVLDQHAVRPRFMRKSANEVVELQPFAARLERLPPAAGAVRASADYDVAWRAGQAGGLAAAVAGRASTGPVPLDADVLELAARLRGAAQPCGVPLDRTWREALRLIAWRFMPYMSSGDAADVIAALRGARCLGDRGAAKAWLDLVDAIARRDVARIRALAPPLLDGEPAGEPLPRWPVSALLLADLEAGEPAAVVRRLAAWGERAPDAIEVQYLRAYARARMAP